MCVCVCVCERERERERERESERERHYFDLDNEIINSTKYRETHFSLLYAKYNCVGLNPYIKDGFLIKCKLFNVIMVNVISRLKYLRLHYSHLSIKIGDHWKSTHL